MRKAFKCRCTDENCTRWYVDPEASQEDIGEFTEDQATQVVILLDTIDREADKPTATDAFTGDVANLLSNVMAENLVARRQTLFKPNTIVAVRVDLLSAAYLEIESLRKQLRERGNRMAQFWIGKTDFNYLLTEVGGWHVGCQNDREDREAVRYGIQHGLIGTRRHYAEAWPDGVDAYELTDAGLDYVAQRCGLKAFDTAKRVREWYRDQERIRTETKP